MSAARSDLMPNITVINVGTLAASKVLAGMKFKAHSRIKSISYIDQTGVAADDTNYLQIAVQDASSNSIATWDTRSANQGALSAFVAADLVLAAGGSISKDANSGELDVPAGQTLRLSFTKNGTGVPTLGQLQIEWYPA